MSLVETIQETMNNYPLLRVSAEVTGLYLTSYATVTFARGLIRYNHLSNYNTTLRRCMKKRALKFETFLISGGTTAVGYALYRTLSPLL